MSYPGYTPTPPPPGTTTPTYPYSYHPSAYAHPTTPGAYPYAAGAYQAGVTSYWPYTYSYAPQAHPQTSTATGTTTTHLLTTAQLLQQHQALLRSTPASVTPHVPTVSTSISSLPQRSATFSSYTPNYARETMSSYSTGGRGGRRQSNLKGLFTKELKNLMYGFGDDRNPANDTVNVMEEILIEYITDVCQVATGPTKKSRLSIDDLRRALSRPADAKKLARMEELLFMQEDIKRARAQFEESDIQNTRGLQ
ncbi:transcription initiation factor IID, 18kD subunit-domain-containing protein [Gymnopilus junonius]|uniref:Transcription initiation factor TFIID subunit 13 n=1 Tax=Gymnopilus junonius TaxID=109634 RepID=A0A9P5NSR9_GYMJU|nr:transcription initiation factor IID, 18kD subunit-domain-containing protein [Gymnopilus junonius]